MSNTQFAFFPRSRVPSRRALQASIDALGFPLKLHPKLDFSKDLGFSPCVLDGEQGAGFEVGLDSTAALLSEDEALAKLRNAVATRDACITPEPLSEVLKGAEQALALWRKERKRGRRGG